MKKLAFTLPERPTSKHAFEYQELCEQLQPIYGKAIWTVPHLVGVNEYKIREAHKVCVRRGILRLPYLIGVIKKM
jgi:hypothetical protein